MVSMEYFSNAAATPTIWSDNGKENIIRAGGMYILVTSDGEKINLGTTRIPAKEKLRQLDKLKNFSKL